MNELEISLTQNALEVQEQAAAWLARSIGVEWSERDQVALDAWLAASAAHKLAYWRLNAAWARSGRLAALRTVTTASVSRRRLWPIAFGLTAAAAAAVVVWGLGVANWPLQPALQTFSTLVGGHQILKLTDGSQIELNTDTVIRIGLGAATRTAVLVKGEAFFQIKHDPAQPFVVNAGSHRVVDLGTKFLVRDDLGQLRVTLVEGKARLESEAAKTQALLLLPGDVAVATATTMSLTARPRASVAAELGWRRGLLIFGSASLADAAAEFNRYNKVKLVIADTETAKIVIGGTFQANDVRTFAEVARNLLRLTIKDRGGEIVISR